MPHFVALILTGQLLAQHQLREPVQLEPVVPVIDLGERVLLDLADHPIAFPVAAQRPAQTLRKDLHEPADGKNIPWNGLGCEVGAQLK